MIHRSGHRAFKNEGWFDLPGTSRCCSSWSAKGTYVFGFWKCHRWDWTQLLRVNSLCICWRRRRREQVERTRRFCLRPRLVPVRPLPPLFHPSRLVQINLALRQCLANCPHPLKSSRLLSESLSKGTPSVDLVRQPIEALSKNENRFISFWYAYIIT